MAKVLIVDDAAFMRLSIRQILEKNNITVCGEACNGKEAVSKVKEVVPDIITMDITMPEMDGISAVKEILPLNPNIKIIMVSAMGQESLVREAILAGAKGFIVKPFKEDSILGALKSFL